MAVRVGDKVFSPVTNFGRRSAGGPRGAVEGGGGGWTGFLRDCLSAGTSGGCLHSALSLFPSLPRWLGTVLAHLAGLLCFGAALGLTLSPTSLWLFSFLTFF